MARLAVTSCRDDKRCFEFSASVIIPSACLNSELFSAETSGFIFFRASILSCACAETRSKFCWMEVSMKPCVNRNACAVFLKR